MTERRRRVAVLAGILVVSGAGVGVAFAGDRQAGKERARKAEAEHVIVAPDAVKWTDAPSALPSGAQLSVLEGDPTRKGPFTMRLRMPADYEIPPHTHPFIERVTVVSGTFHIAMGEKKDRSRGSALSSGGYVALPAHSPHYAWATEETVIQLHGTGPWAIDYVDPADDPRQRVRGEEEE